MKILCVRQPWAWAIIHAKKDVENRKWATSYRGPLLIAAAKAPVYRLDSIISYLAERRVRLDLDALQYGGIIGMIELVDCLTIDSRLKEGDSWEREQSFKTATKSRWCQGPVYWVLKNPRPLPFMPITGQLRLFDPPPNVKAKLKKLGVL
jgi:hypothetical protein